MTYGSPDSGRRLFFLPRLTTSSRDARKVMEDTAHRLLKADLIIMRTGSHPSHSLPRFVVMSICDTAHRLLKPDQTMYDVPHPSHALPLLVVTFERCWNLSPTGY